MIEIDGPLYPDEQSNSGARLKEIARAAALLGVPAVTTDKDGYECCIIAAAIDETSGALVYVRSRAKQLRARVDIEIRVHVRSAHGADESSAIETYNPFFGCDVHFLEWMGGSALLIYREKHHFYACRAAPGTRAVFVEIADDWLIDGATLLHWGWKATRVDRLSLPELIASEPLSEADSREWLARAGEQDARDAEQSPTPFITRPHMQPVTWRKYLAYALILSGLSIVVQWLMRG